MRYAFEDFVLDPANRRLSRGDAPVAITGRVLDILMVLVERHGQLVEKDTLIERVWGDLAVEEGNLARNISTLRKVLGEPPDDRRFISTLSGRGYQFVAPVTVLASEAVAAPHARAEIHPEYASEQPAQPPMRRPFWRWHTAAGVAALILLALAAGPRVTPVAHSPGGAPRIAVLPFKNLGSADDTDMAAAMTEEITTKIAQIDALRVVARTSVGQYASAGKAMRTIGMDLGAEYVLDGSVHWRHGEPADRVRITARLVRTADDTHAWVETFDRNTSDLFRLQAEIAIRVARELKGTVLADERAALETQPAPRLDAYRLYLKGLFHASRPDLSIETATKATAYFEQAVERDPSFAQAYAALARQHVRHYQFGYDPSRHRLELAKQALDRAQALAPQRSDTQLARSYYALATARLPGEALAAAAEAERRLPNDAALLLATATAWFRTGHWRQAADRLTRARDLDTRNPLIYASLGPVLIGLRRYAEAQHALARSLMLEPDQTQAYVAQIWNVWLWKGDLAESRTLIERLPATDDWRFMDLRFLQAIYERKFDRAAEVPSPYTGTWMRTNVMVRPVVLLEAQARRLAGDAARARTAFETAHRLLEVEARAQPDDGRVRAALAIALAGLGRKADAAREAHHAIELMPYEGAFDTAVVRIDAAIALTMSRHYDAAVHQLSILLSEPSPFSIEVLKLDPRFDPLREHPKYSQLLASVSDRP